MPQGVYLHSRQSGTGKTMLMDLFKECLPTHIECRREHFNTFMLQVHNELQAQGQSSDPLQAVARKFTRCVLGLLHRLSIPLGNSYCEQINGLID
jgi:predicted ATPase